MKLATAGNRGYTSMEEEPMVKPRSEKADGELADWQIAEIRKGVAEADAGDFASDREVAAIFRRLCRMDAVARKRLPKSDRQT